MTRHTEREVTALRQAQAVVNGEDWHWQKDPHAERNHHRFGTGTYVALDALAARYRPTQPCPCRRPLPAREWIAMGADTTGLVVQRTDEGAFHADESVNPDCPWCHGTGLIATAEGDGEEPEGCWERQGRAWRWRFITNVQEARQLNADGKYERRLDWIIPRGPSPKREYRKIPSRPRECSILAADPAARETAMRDAGVRHVSVDIAQGGDIQATVVSHQNEHGQTVIDSVTREYTPDHQHRRPR